VHEIRQAGCNVRRANCGTGPTNLWEFVDADGVNPSGRSFKTRKEAVDYGTWRLGNGLS